MRREQVIEIRTLLERAASKLQLSLLVDHGGLDSEIRRARIQKPGLALSGFARHVRGDRLQVLGLTEIDFLFSHFLSQ